MNIEPNFLVYCQEKMIILLLIRVFEGDVPCRDTQEGETGLQRFAFP